MQGHMLSAEAQLSYSEIHSPIDGVVTDRPLYEGDLANANQPILTVMNPSRLIAKAHIPQSEAAVLKVGTPAELKIAGLDAAIKGRVSLVSPALDPGSTTIEVWVEASKPDPALKPGMGVEVSMTAKTVKEALVVPTPAIFKNSLGQDYVLLAGSDGHAHLKTVQLGVRNADFAQIVSGVIAGDPVISSGGYALPDNTQIKIEAQAPAEKEAADTAPKTGKSSSVRGLRKVQSITSGGSAEVDLFFDWNSDMILTLQRVAAVVPRMQAELPPTAKVETHRLTFASFPILGYSLTSDTIPQNRLWEIATYDIKPRVNRLDGVASVLVQGGRVPEFQVTPDPARLLTAGITVNDILEAIRRTNLIDSPGLIENNHQLVLGLISGQGRTAEQIGQVVVKSSTAGIPIRLGDIAKIAPSVAPVYTMVTANGKPSVLLSVHRQPDSNTLDVANEVHSQIEEIRPTLPPGVHIEPFYDQSTIVHESIASVRDAVLLGLLLSSVILVLFLRDWGTSLVAGLVIPATLLITFIVLRLTGESFNLMTLGGLAAAVGLVIDDAIGVLENIVLHRDAGQGRFEAIQSALKEMTVPLIGHFF